ncbi:putative MFS transporter [Aspergillus clavatus NRRL 1]|uniref:MFS transporter, putative n=1 Tax=Aspergillus clavatus (strain ATCC 1007 / CBS 513.65 / DSM 816 / NCTC 3887 / NRRL 1 / QM 1276 / 107) TaxID=344612 RepID=A1CPC3_ASPCL|nr:MFS transporter, putative [Aspergillus clavatus NRRL 1]EAW07494.1 MFS transporter, putative [Aspergillus clavatus NRRL 1]
MSVVVARPVKKEVISDIEPISPLDSDFEKTPIAITRVLSCTQKSDLGDQRKDRRSWFRWSKGQDLNAIATQPSVYDDPELAEEYRPRTDWENIHRFDPSARWTWGEEKKVVRKIDLRITVWACIMLMALELDRSNIQQANADNFLRDLNLSRDDYNLGNTIHKLCYLLAELPAQVIAKWVGADRWVPIQMTSWSTIALCQFWLSGRTSFLCTRALLGLLSGGFTPTMILYLSYFFKHHELSIRLGFWYTASSVADIFAGLLAYGILHLRGVGGLAGWRWLFLIEGLLTLTLGLLAFALMPASPTQTANWARGKDGWFTEREEVIMVNRIIREDPSKGTMHNRQPLTLKLIWSSVTDFDLWPLYIIGLLFVIPNSTISQYFTLLMKDFGFSTFKVILLSIPYNALGAVTRLFITFGAEAFGSLAYMGILAQVWMLPMLLYMNVVNFSQINKWAAWTVLTLLLAFPNPHAMHAGWNSRNSNSVRTRAVAAALYNMCMQMSSIIASNVYHGWDAPRYVVGNRTLLIIVCTNILLYGLTKVYYVLRNRRRDRQWMAMTEDQRVDYVATTKVEGNKRLDFRFAH